MLQKASWEAAKPSRGPYFAVLGLVAKVGVSGLICLHGPHAAYGKGATDLTFLFPGSNKALNLKVGQ